MWTLVHIASTTSASVNSPSAMPAARSTPRSSIRSAAPGGKSQTRRRTRSTSSDVTRHRHFRSATSNFSEHSGLFSPRDFAGSFAELRDAPNPRVLHRRRAHPCRRDLYPIRRRVSAGALLTLPQHLASGQLSTLPNRKLNEWIGAGGRSAQYVMQIISTGLDCPEPAVVPHDDRYAGAVDLRFHSKQTRTVPPCTN